MRLLSDTIETKSLIPVIFAGAAGGMAFVVYEQYLLGKPHETMDYFAFLYLGGFTAFLTHIFLLMVFGFSDMALTTAAAFLLRPVLTTLHIAGGKWIKQKADDLWKR